MKKLGSFMEKPWYQWVIAALCFLMTFTILGFCSSSRGVYYARAKEFAKQHLGMEDPFFFCNSWLIHPWMTEDLPESSRIVQFQKKYKVIHIEQDENAVIHQVFDHAYEDPKDYPEDNTLLRSG